MDAGRHTIEGVLRVYRYAKPGRGRTPLARLADSRINRRYWVIYTIWLGENEEKWPLVRFRAVRGIGESCDGHRVRLRATLKEPFTNGLGNDAIRVVGECLEPGEHALAALAGIGQTQGRR